MSPIIAQCVMCFRTAAAQQLERSRVLNSGILILLIPPIVVLGLILFMAWRKSARPPIGLLEKASYRSFAVAAQKGERAAQKGER
jgi:hypothetical protein